jgi:DMSO/TMAO reductase YedYZ molybdopterin-dependent catalytic subunit
MIEPNDQPSIKSAPVASLPPGQKSRPDMPAFGLPWYAHRMPTSGAPVSLVVEGLIDAPFEISATDLAELPRAEQTTDFHCVSMWSRVAVSWSGVRFTDVYEHLLAPRVASGRTVQRVRFRAADGYRDDLPLGDVLAPGVLLADTMDGQPLSRGNGSPLRLVAPAHYGYKNVKFITNIDLLGAPARRPLITLHHPRARVAEEERLPYPVPQRAVGVLYKATLRRPTRWWFRRIMSR